MTVREPDVPMHARLSGWQRVVALAIAAFVVVIVVLVTRSAEAVTAVVTSLLLLLGWLSTGTGGTNDT